MLRVSLFMICTFLAGFAAEETNNWETLFHEHGIQPDVIRKTPQERLEIFRKLDGKRIETASSHSIDELRDRPDIRWKGNPEKLYSLFILNPDVPSRREAYEAEWQHMAAYNIPGSDISKGDIVVEYSPLYDHEDSAGIQRVVILVFEQKQKIDTSQMVTYDKDTLRKPNGENRGNFHIKPFIYKVRLNDRGNDFGDFFYLIVSKKNESSLTDDQSLSSSIGAEGSPCASKDDCQTKYLCINGTCQVRKYKVPVDSSLTETSPNGANNDEETSSTEEDQEEYSEEDESSFRKAEQLIYEEEEEPKDECKSDSDCVKGNSHCVNGKCFSSNAPSSRGTSDAADDADAADTAEAADTANEEDNEEDGQDPVSDSKGKKKIFFDKDAISKEGVDELYEDEETPGTVEIPDFNPKGDDRNKVKVVTTIEITNNETKPQSYKTQTFSTTLLTTTSTSSFLTTTTSTTTTSTSTTRSSSTSAETSTSSTTSSTEERELKVRDMLEIDPEGSTVPDEDKQEDDEPDEVEDEEETGEKPEEESSYVESENPPFQAPVAPSISTGGDDQYGEAIAPKEKKIKEVTPQESSDEEFEETPEGPESSETPESPESPVAPETPDSPVAPESPGLSETAKNEEEKDAINGEASEDDLLRPPDADHDKPVKKLESRIAAESSSKSQPTGLEHSKVPDNLLGYYKYPKTCDHHNHESCQFLISWFTTGTPNEIRFSLSARDVNSTAIGFSPTKYFAGSDIVTATRSAVQDQHVNAMKFYWIPREI